MWMVVMGEKVGGVAFSELFCELHESSHTECHLD